MSLPAEHWLQRGEEDQLNQSLYRVPDGKHVTYEELLAEVDPGVAKELTPEVFQKRHAANQKGIAKVAEALERSAPTCWSCSAMTSRRPSTTIICRRSVSCWGEQVPYVPRQRTRGTQALTAWAYPQEPRMYPGHPELALHIIDGMMEQGFDVAHSKYLREGQSITHAVTFVYARILQGRTSP